MSHNKSSLPLIPPSDSTHTSSPHNNDVLCGRGGTINAHPGNEQYRKFVERKKRVYLTARFKREKRLIASSIVEEIRTLDPPGRFLMKDPTSAHGTDIWYDVGDEKARDKTSQALRENALSVRKQMEEEFQETRRQQAREVAIAAGRDPDEAVENMMSAVVGSTSASAAKKGKEKKIPAAVAPSPAPPSSSGAGGGGGFVGRSGYGPLYDAQQPAPPQAAVPHPGSWGYHRSMSAPVPAPHPGHPPPSGHLGPHPGAPPPHPPPTGHYPYYQQPPPPGHVQQPPQPHPAYSYGAHPQPPQPPHPAHQPPPGHPHQHPHQAQPPAPPHQQSHPHSQYPQPPYTTSNPWPSQHQPQHLPQQPQLSQPPQQPLQHPPAPPHTLNVNPPPSLMLAPRPSSQPPLSSRPPHAIVAGPGPPQPHPMIPSTIGGHPMTVIGTIDHPAPAPGAVMAQLHPPPGPPAAPINTPPQQHRVRANSPHVQFQIQNGAPAGAPDYPQRVVGEVGTTSTSIPLIISSKKRIQPRKQPSHHSQQHQQQQQQHSRNSVHSDYSPDPSSQLSSSPGGRQQPQSTINSSPMTLSPKSEMNTSHAAMSQATNMTSTTPLTFLSGDLSVKTSESLSHYLRGIEDEISGDVGQEVELVAHAPMLDGSGGKQAMEHHNHRQIAQQQQRAYTRPTPPRHHPRHNSSGASQKSVDSRHSRRRKRRSGNHVPSNSGKVQVDWGNPTAPAPVGTPTAGGVTCGAGGVLAPDRIFVGTSPQTARVGSSSALPCVDNAASCGVILPTPLRSSNNGPSRSPTTIAMAPPPGMPPMSPVMHHNSIPAGNVAPMSPQSLDLEKMSLCGTEHLSQTGGSIGGASLCNVFDENEDSVIGPSLMDAMSLGSHPSSGPSDPEAPHPAGSMGLQPVPLGLNPQTVFGDPGVSNFLAGSALMDMSVGSGTNSKAGSHRSQNSGNSSSNSSRRKSGRGSPASIDKAGLDGSNKMDQLMEQQQFANDSALHDFKFTWDGKREE